MFGDQALAVPAFGTQDIEHVGLFGRVEIVDRRIADVAGCDLTVLLGEPPLSEIGFAGKGPDDPPLGDALGADFVTQRAVEQFEQDEESQYEQERGEACRGTGALMIFSVAEVICRFFWRRRAVLSAVRIER